MLVINNDQMIAFEAAMQITQRSVFVDLVAKHQETLGEFSPGQAALALDAARDEAARAGIDTDARLFIYAMARMIMPQMTGPQYLLVTDLVFAPLSEPAKLLAIVAIRDMPNG